MQSRSWGRLFVGVGVLVGISSLVHLVSEYLRSTAQGHLLLALFLIGGAGLSIGYGGYWHLRNPFTASRYPRIGGWMLAGVLLFTAVNVVSLYVGSSEVTPSELVEVVHVASSIGAAVGLLVGSIEATAIRHFRTAARAEARADAMAAERERMNRVNEFLRHYVLNSLTVISGYRTHLDTGDAPDDRPAADAVEERIETITTLVDHVRTLSNGYAGASQSDQELEELLESTVRESLPSRPVDVEVPDDLPTITVSPSFERALSLLFETLDEVIDHGQPLTVTAREADGAVSISVATERPVAISEADFAAAGPETKIKYAIVAEFVGGTGRLRVGDDPEDTLACELVLDGESAVRAEPTTASP